MTDPVIYMVFDGMCHCCYSVVMDTDRVRPAIQEVVQDRIQRREEPWSVMLDIIYFTGFMENAPWRFR